MKKGNDNYNRIVTFKTTSMGLIALQTAGTCMRNIGKGIPKVCTWFPMKDQ
ncbi:MAG: hypothetical protein JXB00_03360 [Bacteroidales bacterium]|nr:hypothetical protein [Bacteroidales bacterium]